MTYKIFGVATKRRQRWEPFGQAANDPRNHELTEICEDVKLVLRYPTQTTGSSLSIREVVEEDIKKAEQTVLMKTRRRILEEEEEEEKKENKNNEEVNITVYRPPSNRIIDSMPDDIPKRKKDELRSDNVIVITDLNEVYKPELENLFDIFGVITRLHTITHDNSDHVRIAFIHYADKRDAMEALTQMHKKPHNQMLMHVEYAKNRLKNN